MEACLQKRFKNNELLLTSKTIQSHDAFKVRPFPLYASRDFDNLIGQMKSWQSQSAAEPFSWLEKKKWENLELWLAFLLLYLCPFPVTRSLVVAPVASVLQTGNSREQSS